MEILQFSLVSVVGPRLNPTPLITTTNWCILLSKKYIPSPLCIFFFKRYADIDVFPFKYKVHFQNMQKSSPETFSMGAYQTPKFWCFFLFSKIKHSCCCYISACTEATAMFFIRDDRKYPPIRFEYRTAFDGSTVAEIFAEQFWVYFAKIDKLQVSLREVENLLARLVSEGQKMG